MIAAASPILSHTARFTPEQYIHLSENNMLGQGRTELINGEIIRVCSQFDQHAYGVTELYEALQPIFPKSKFWIRQQATLQCNDNLPEPDLAVVTGTRTATRTIMNGQRAVLIVEVSDSTVLMDTEIKPAIYAAVGIKDYWVMDLNARQLIVHRDPVISGRNGPRYKSIQTLDTTQKIAPLAAPKKVIKIAKIMP